MFRGVIFIKLNVRIEENYFKSISIIFTVFIVNQDLRLFAI